MSLEFSLADAVSALGWTLIHTLWQGALIAAAYAMFRFLARGRDVRLRYAGGLAALLLLLALPAATLISLLGASSGVSVDGAVAAVAQDTWSTRVEAALPLIVLAWVAGVLAMGLREAWRFRAVRALLLGSAVQLDEWTDRAARIARQLRVSRPVQVVSSTLARTPSLVGWLKPVIVLPASALLALSPRQLEMVIAHELAHVSRGDYVVNLLQVVAQTLLFHHPVVHWISHDVRALREVCCDDLVLRSGVDPLHYADTLASLEELRGFTHAPALAVTGGSLLLRVRRIVGVGAEAPPRPDGQMVVLCAGLLSLVALFAGQRPVAEASTAAATPSAALARGAVAAVEAGFAPAVVALPAAIAVAPSPVAARPDPAPRAARASAPQPAASSRRVRVAPVPAPVAPALALDVAPQADAPAVGDVQSRRRVYRTLIVLAEDSPTECIRTVGSRLCRALPRVDSPEAVVIERKVILARAGRQGPPRGAHSQDPRGR